jgi:chemotaxis protein MotB
VNDFPKKRRNTDDEDGWALTLADMMTLLLCFFVLMLAISEVDSQKYSTVAESLSSAMGGKSKTPQQSGSMTMSVAPARNLFAMQLELARMLKLETDSVRLAMRPDAVAIELKGTAFFRSGSADLTPKAATLLRKIVTPLVKSTTQYDFVVEGHTDDVPMHSARYPSNWELSSARASAVARKLIADGLPKHKVKVLGLADTRPVVPNLSASGVPIEQNRSRNRRVVILVKPVLE